MEAIHIDAKKGDIANVVLMPGDPLRAKYIAETYLTNIKQINSVRNMFGYTGYYKNKRITVMGCGMGIPSVGIYSYELYNFYDVDIIIKIGTAGSLDENIKVNDVILAEEAYSPSSFGYVWGKNVNNLLKSNSQLNEKILETARDLDINIKHGTILTADVFTVYANIDHILKKVPQHIKLLANEMEAFGLFHVANICNKKASCIVSVVDSPFEKEMLSPEEKEKKLNDMIIIALESVYKNYL